MSQSATSKPPMRVKNTTSLSAGSTSGGPGNSSGFASIRMPAGGSRRGSAAAPFVARRSSSTSPIPITAGWSMDIREGSWISEGLCYPCWYLRYRCPFPSFSALQKFIPITPDDKLGKSSAPYYKLAFDSRLLNPREYFPRAFRTPSHRHYTHVAG